MDGFDQWQVLKRKSNGSIETMSRNQFAICSRCMHDDEGRDASAQWRQPHQLSRRVQHKHGSNDGFSAIAFHRSNVKDLKIPQTLSQSIIRPYKFLSLCGLAPQIPPQIASMRPLHELRPVSRAKQFLRSPETVPGDQFWTRSLMLFATPLEMVTAPPDDSAILESAASLTTETSSAPPAWALCLL